MRDVFVVKINTIFEINSHLFPEKSSFVTVNLLFLLFLQTVNLKAFPIGLLMKIVCSVA